MPKIGIDIGYYNPRKIVPISFTDGTNSGGGNTSIMTDYLTRLAAEGGSLTAPEIVALNLLTQNADIGEFDRLWIHGLSNQIAARISLVNALTADLITNVNSTTFTAGEGFTGNGTTMYLDTNYNPSVDGVKYTLNSASFGIYKLLNAAGCLIGSFNGGGTTDWSALYPFSGIYGLNQSYSGVNGLVISDNGLVTISRSSSANFSTNINGVVNETIINPSIALNNRNLFLLAVSNNGASADFSSNKIAFSFIGSGAIDQAQFYTDVQTLGTTLGWAV